MWFCGWRRAGAVMGKGPRGTRAPAVVRGERRVGGERKGFRQLLVTIHSMETALFTDKAQFYVFVWTFPCGLTEFVSIANSSPRPLWQNHLHPHLVVAQWNNHSHLCNLLEVQYM